MSKAPKKRFIAGAVCPKCAARDRIVMYSVDGQQIRECVECDFKDEIRLQSKPNELKTRVNAPHVSAAEDVTPIKVISPKPDES